MGENPGAPISFDAAADLSAKQYFLVKVSAANTVNLAGDGELAIGALQNKPTAGQAATVSMDGGVTFVSAGAAVAAGASIAADSNGQGITAATGKEIVGVAKTAAAALGDLFEMVQLHTGPSA